MSKTTEAFQNATGSTTHELGNTLSVIFFAVFLIIVAYILSNLFEEIKEGNLSLPKAGWVLIRIMTLFCILGYFFLH